MYVDRLFRGVNRLFGGVYGAGKAKTRREREKNREKTGERERNREKNIEQRSRGEHIVI